ncbi:hypothetical protein DM46_2511 [Burkholderia mallei]|nr:hypothetical protein DM46_2511 [Burkholderia mallei]
MRARIVPARDRHLARRLHVEPPLTAAIDDERLRTRVTPRHHHQHGPRRRVERADGHVVDHPAVEHRPAVAAQDGRERRRARRLEHEIRELVDARAILRADELGAKAERAAECRMQRLADVFLDVVRDESRRHRASRAEPARHVRHADADVRRAGELRERLAVDVEKRLAIDPVMRKDRLGTQQIAPMDIPAVVPERLFVIAHHPARVARVEHAGGRRARRDAGDHARPQIERGPHDVPEPRLPPAAVAAAREYHLIEHRMRSRSSPPPPALRRRARTSTLRERPSCRPRRTARFHRTRDCGPSAARER